MKSGPTEKPEVTEFYLGLLIRIYRDAALRCGLRSSSVERDIVTLTERTHGQGMAFLTKVLPSLGKRFDESLSKDVPFGPCVGFASSAKPPEFPLLFRELWNLVFDREGLAIPPSERGLLRRVEAVRAIRQICYLLYKLEGSHSRESEAKVLTKFVETDASLPGPDDKLSFAPKVERALENAALLAWYVLRSCDLEHITPGHGPGAVATGEKPHEKMFFKRLVGKLEEKYPFADYFFLNYSHLAERLDTLERLTEVSEGTAKVVLVPKDSRGPRLISMEPLENQWIQQGQMRALVRTIEQRDAITAGYVNFTTQEINRNLALSSSLGFSDFVTLDMEEASDRVSLWLVRRILPRNLVSYLEASRSTRTQLPNGDVVALKKFAPMGSSVCFPIEALIFWCLAVGSLVGVLRRKDLLSLPPVYVFGDDIVMPRQHYDAARPVFEAVKLRFNDSKCCTGRFFRESCGLEAYCGFHVTPTRIRTPWADRLSPAATLSYVSYVNNLRQKGYYSAADYITACNTKVFGRLPIASNPSQLPLVLVRPDADRCWCESDLFSRFRVRYNAALQRTEVRILTTYTPTQVVGSPDWDELFQSLLRMGPPDPFGVSGGKLDPGCYPVPHQIKMRWNWVPLESVLN